MGGTDRALLELIEERRRDPEFIERLHRIVEENRDVLDLLEDSGMANGGHEIEDVVEADDVPLRVRHVTAEIMMPVHEKVFEAAREKTEAKLRSRAHATIDPDEAMETWVLLHVLQENDDQRQEIDRLRRAARVSGDIIEVVRSALSRYGDGTPAKQVLKEISHGFEIYERTQS